MTSGNLSADLASVPDPPQEASKPTRGENYDQLTFNLVLGHFFVNPTRNIIDLISRFNTYPQLGCIDRVWFLFDNEYVRILFGKQIPNMQIKRRQVNPLTKRQKEILEYIRGFIDENGYAPSFREIAFYFDFSSTGTVAEYVNILQEKGYITKDAMEARAIQLTPSFDTGLEIFNIPLEGVIDAGRPIEAIRTHETIDIPRDMMGRKTFALRVRGDSMIEDGILEGDYVIIEQTNSVRNGEIVVALVDNENATLKRFYDEKTGIRLQPANRTMKPMFFAKKRITIQGKVKGVIRKFNK